MKAIRHYLAKRAAERRDAERYRWLREHPAFETELYLSDCSPAMYDMTVDFYRQADSRHAQCRKEEP